MQATSLIYNYGLFKLLFLTRELQSKNDVMIIINNNCLFNNICDRRDFTKIISFL